MWEFYRKTFLPMQAMIWLVGLGIFFITGRNLLIAGVFVLMMQFGSLFGAAWGVRLRRKISGNGELPLSGFVR